MYGPMDVDVSIMDVDVSASQSNVVVELTSKEPAPKWKRVRLTIADKIAILKGIWTLARMDASANRTVFCIGDGSANGR